MIVYIYDNCPHPSMYFNVRILYKIPVTRILKEYDESHFQYVLKIIKQTKLSIFNMSLFY